MDACRRRLSIRAAARRFVLLCGFATFVADADAGSPPLRERIRIPLHLHSPTNVVVGRVDGKPLLAVQGMRRDGEKTFAAIEVHTPDGRLAWSDAVRPDGIDHLAGAYVQWIEGPGIYEPLVAYSFCPQRDGTVGGVRLLAAKSGELRHTFANSTRFGNNNSIVADVDGDSCPEFLYADQRNIVCYDLKTFAARWKYNSGVVFCWSLPALADLKDDRKPAIVFGSEYNNEDGSSAMIAIDRAGQPIWRRDGFAEDLGSTPVFSVDVDGDGRRELVKVGLDLEHRRNQQWNHVHVFDVTGKLLAQVEFGCTGAALGDFDGDGRWEAVGITNTRDGGRNGRREIRCIDLVSKQLRWTTDLERAYLDNNSPLSADVDGDGELEAVVGTGNPAGYARLPNSEPWGDIYVVGAKGGIKQRLQLPGWPVNFALCDLDADGLAEAIVVMDGLPGGLVIYETTARTAQRDWPTPLGSPDRTGAFQHGGAR